MQKINSELLYYIKENIELPPQILSVMDKKKKATKISSYEELKRFLLK